MSDRRPHLNTDITAEQVTQAIVQLMRGSSGDGHVDNALAASLAGQVLPAVQKQFAGKSSTQLGTEPAFRSLVSLHIATATTPDPGIVRLNTGHHNIHGADHAAAERAGLHGSAHGRFAALITGVGVDRGSGMPELSATNGNLTIEQARNMAAARSLAAELGMSWAANHSELLKLGPAAIKALHDVGVQRERYERMTGDKVGFKAETAVAIARFAKRHNLTPEQTNRLYDSISSGAEVVSGGSKHIQRELDQATREYTNGPDTPEARDKLRKSWEKHADTPGKKAAAAQATQALIDAAEQAQRKEVRAEVKEQAAEITEQAAAAKKTADLGDLDDPAPAKSESPQLRAEAAPAPNSAPATTTAAAPPADKAPAEKTQTAAAPAKPSAPKMA